MTLRVVPGSGLVAVVPLDEAVPVLTFIAVLGEEVAADAEAEGPPGLEGDAAAAAPARRKTPV